MIVVALVATIRMNVCVGSINRGKNRIGGRNMYSIHGGGERKMNNLVNLFYTNAKSLKLFGNCPKLNIAKQKLKEEDVDIISIAEAGYHWSKSIEKQAKYQLRRIKGSTIMATSHVADGDPGSLTGGTLTATVGGISGSVTGRGSDKQGR